MLTTTNEGKDHMMTTHICITLETRQLFSFFGDSLMEFHTAVVHMEWYGMGRKTGEPKQCRESENLFYIRTTMKFEYYLDIKKRRKNRATTTTTRRGGSNISPTITTTIITKWQIFTVCASFARIIQDWSVLFSSV